MEENKQKGRRKYKPTMDSLAKMVLKRPQITKHLIHSVLNLDVKSVEILDGTQYRKTEITSENTQLFYTQVDILASLEDKSQVIIEIQVAKQESFLQRLLVYLSEQYVENFEKAKQRTESTHSAYRYIYPVYVISILAENYFEDDVPFHNFKLKDENSDTLFTDSEGRELLNFAFLELKKYDESKLTGSLKNWFQYWGNLEIDQTADEEIFEADDLLDDSKWKTEVEAMIKKEALAMEDFKATLEAAEEKKAIQMALNMFKKGLSLQDVQEISGLSLDVIKKIRDDNQLTHA